MAHYSRLGQTGRPGRERPWSSRKEGNHGLHGSTLPDVGLKDRLATRKRPSAVYSLRVDDDRVARSELAAAQVDGDEDRIVAAQLAVEACYEQLTVTALAPVEFEALLEEHPPPADQRQKMFNPKTFVPALLVACVDSDVDEETWADYTTTGAMTIGEVGGLFQVAWDVNYREPSADLLKG